MAKKSLVSEIAKRAKKIRKPGEKWITAIKRASLEIKNKK